MKILVIHKHFPGQFLNICDYLSGQPDCQLVGIGSNIRGLHSFPVLSYSIPATPSRDSVHPYLREYESQIKSGQAVAKLCLRLRQGGFYPDVVLSHPGWGESLFIKEVFPRAKNVVYAEYYYRATNSDLDFDPEFPPFPEEVFFTRVRNAALLTSMDAADRLVAPTEWQRSQFPRVFQPKIEVIHDGIRSDRLHPHTKARLRIPSTNVELTVADEVVTYVARALEPYRGFHTFIRSLPELFSRRPSAQIIIAGDDCPVYGRRLRDGLTYRQKLWAEVETKVPKNQVHFVNALPYSSYLSALQISSAHVYLTYPFVLSWSMLEAMAVGCAVAASSTPPVREVIEHRSNGYLFDFFSPNELAGRLAKVLEDRGPVAKVRQAARDTILQRYDFATVSLPRYLGLLE